MANRNRFMYMEIIIWSLLVVPLFFLLTEVPSIQYETIPTVINGLTTCISILTGFNSALFFFIIKDGVRTRQLLRRTVVMMFLIGLSSAMLWTIFNFMFRAEYVSAIKVAMFDLAFSFTLTLDLFVFLLAQTIFGRDRQTLTNKPFKDSLSI